MKLKTWWTTANYDRNGNDTQSPRQNMRDLFELLMFVFFLSPIWILMFLFFYIGA